MLRVQIKTGWIREGRIDFHGKSQHTNSTGNTYSTYEGEVDYFIVYIPELESMYLIGEREFETGMQLRVSEPKQSHATINWAEDFLFDNRWPPQQDSRPIARGHPELEKSISVLRQYDLDVARTVTTESYHLLIDTGEDTVRLAIDSGWVQDGRIRFHPSSRVERNIIDWFLVYCDETEQAYLVSPDEFDRSISLRVSEPETEMPSINWAEDYRFEERWQE